MDATQQNNVRDYYLLAGDIGGTKTSLAIFSGESGSHSPLHAGTFQSEAYGSLEVLVQDFLEGVETSPHSACFGVAGPVTGGRVEVTNLPWQIEAAHLRKALGLEEVQLINDLQAIAQSILILESEDLHTLNEGEAAENGTIAVIAPGTGLGEAFLTWNGERYVPQPSEGGHTDLGPTDELQLQLVKYMMERYDQVSYERVCSGVGMPNIYSFLKAMGFAEEPKWLTRKLAAASDPTPVIVDAALDKDKPCELCRKTLEVFVSLLAAEAGNLALKVLATGGVYLGGGIPPHILPALKEEVFMQAFRNKGPHSDLMARIPVHVILNPDSGLLGAADYGLKNIRRRENLA